MSEQDKVTTPDSVPMMIVPVPGIVPTQVVRPWQATLRTVLQVVLAVAAGLPFVLAGVPLVGVVPGVLAVAAAITRGMANPAVENILSKYVPWLSAGGK